MYSIKGEHEIMRHDRQAAVIAPDGIGEAPER